LVPKKPKDFFKPTADKLGLSEELVEKIVDIYWKEVRKALSSLRAPRITIANFGSFKVKHWIIDEQVKGYKEYLEKNQPENMTFNKHRIRADMEQRIIEIEAMREMVKKDLEKKNSKKQERDAKSNKKDLED
jgi:hypothetical protein